MYSLPFDEEVFYTLTAHKGTAAANGNNALHEYTKDTQSPGAHSESNN